MTLIFISIFTILFFALTWRRFEWGIFGLFLLLPTYLLRFHIGPLPSTILEVMLIILIGVFLLKKFKERLPRQSLCSLLAMTVKQNKVLTTGITIFIVAATASIFTSIDIRKAAGEWRAFYIEPILLFFVLTVYLKNLDAKKRIQTIQKYILLPLILCGLATSILAIYQHFTGWLVPYSFWANRNTYRVTGWYGFPNAVGLFLAPIIPLSIYLIKEKWHEKELKNTYTFISILFLITAPLAILFAKGSAAVIGTAAGIGVLLLCYKKTRATTLVLGAVAFIGIILLPTSSPLKQEIFAQNYSGQLRRNIWIETFTFLKDHPIRGAGIASYEERIVPYRGDHWIEVFHHPHNIFLTIWVNTGLFGLIGFFTILVWFFIQAYKNFDENKFLFASMIVILTMGLVDSPYIKNDLAILFWLLPTFLFSQIPSQRDTQSS